MEAIFRDPGVQLAIVGVFLPLFMQILGRVLIRIFTKPVDHYKTVYPDPPATTIDLGEQQ